MTTTNFGPVTLQTGDHDFGPAAVADTDTLVVVTIDRTVASGLNSKTAATTVTLTVFISFDGGTSWDEMASAGTAGGPLVIRGVTATQTVIGVGLWPGTGRQVKATVSVGGTSVAVAGSLATQ